MLISILNNHLKDLSVSDSKESAESNNHLNDLSASDSKESAENQHRLQNLKVSLPEAAHHPIKFNSPKENSPVEQLLKPSLNVDEEINTIRFGSLSPSPTEALANSKKIAKLHQQLNNQGKKLSLPYSKDPSLYFDETNKAAKDAEEFVARFLQEKDIVEIMSKRFGRNSQMWCWSFLPISYKDANGELHRECLVGISGQYAKHADLHELYEVLNEKLSKKKNDYFKVCLPCTDAVAQFTFDISDKSSPKMHITPCSEAHYMNHLAKVGASFDKLKVLGCVNVAVQTVIDNIKLQNVTKTSCKIPADKNFKYSYIKACQNCQNLRASRSSLVEIATTQRRLQGKNKKHPTILFSPTSPKDFSFPISPSDSSSDSDSRENFLSPSHSPIMRGSSPISVDSPLTLSDSEGTLSPPTPKLSPSSPFLNRRSNYILGTGSALSDSGCNNIYLHLAAKTPGHQKQIYIRKLRELEQLEGDNPLSKKGPSEKEKSNKALGQQAEMELRKEQGLGENEKVDRKLFKERVKEIRDSQKENTPPIKKSKDAAKEVEMQLRKELGTNNVPPHLVKARLKEIRKTELDARSKNKV